MLRKLRHALLALLCVAALLVAYFRYFYRVKPGTYTISKETTYVLGPLFPDGGVNYIEALDARCREGVTPENNAHALITQALGPALSGPIRLPDGIYLRQGIKRPPSGAPALVPLGELLISGGLATVLCDGTKPIYELLQRPWAGYQAPTVARCLEMNAKPLELAHEACLRTRWYAPAIPLEAPSSSGSASSALLLTLQPTQDLSNLLILRAMLSLGEGQTEKARADLIACMRLGRLMTQSSTMYEHVSGRSTEMLAFNATLAWIADPKVTAGEIETLQRELSALPSPRPLADKLDRGERFLYLDLLLGAAHHGLRRLETYPGNPHLKSKAGNALVDILVSGLDYDVALKDANRWFDRLAAAARLDSYSAQKAALTELHRELINLRKDLTVNPEARLLQQRRASALSDLARALLTPDYLSAFAEDAMAEQAHRNLRVAAALALHYRATGQYPDDLTALVPNYLPAVPLDLFSSKPLIYKRMGDGYLLYSVGPNEIDDGGKSAEYRDEMGDDLSVRMPLPPVKPIKAK